MARVRGAAAERIWRERLARFRRSGETIADFCEREGVSTPAFYAWKRRLTGATAAPVGPAKRSAPLFVPLSLGAVAAGVRIALRAGTDEQMLQVCNRAAARPDHDVCEAWIRSICAALRFSTTPVD
jgi:hypothetical protein